MKCTMRVFKPVLRGAIFALAFAAVGQAAALGPGGPPPPPQPTLPTTTDQCRDGGWQSFLNQGVRVFKNQGDCVSYVATKGKNPPAGSSPQPPPPITK